MKQKLLLQCFIFTSLALNFTASAQNADELVSTQYLPQHSYVAGSFQIDSGTSQANSQKRAFLIWAFSKWQDSLPRYLSLSEYDGGLNFLTNQGNKAEKKGTEKTMFAKKIIKSKFERAYYLLSYTINSNHAISGFTVYSSPVVYKIDAATLSLVWARKINLAALNPNNLNTVIEYNDMIETRDKNIVVVGKYALDTKAKESVLATKLKGSTGALMWQYVYKTGNNCNEAANSLAETTDGLLSVTGYVKKCIVGQGYDGNADLFYMQLQATGIPVPATYVRFFWPNRTIWGDKITCYTASAGNDRLFISGYIDILTNTGATDRQILLMNLKESGNLITAQHIGNTATKDVCNDLIFRKTGSTGTDYLIYLTGQTATATSAIGQAYFLYGKTNVDSGFVGLSEFSIFPNSTYPNGSRSGLEIKNAGKYKKFAILATGTYQPVPGAPTTTFSNVLLRDFADTSGKCIQKLKAPVTRFNIDRTFGTLALDTPLLAVYKETWIKQEKLNVQEPCQQIKVDPSEAQNLQPEKRDVPQTAQLLQVSPNPARSAISLSTADGKALTGTYKNAVIKIFNYSMQTQRIVSILPVQGNSIQIPVSQLTPGIYRVQLMRGNEILGCSFIKE